MKKLKSVILKAMMFALIATLVFSGLNVGAYRAGASSDDLLFEGMVAKKVEVGQVIELPDPIGVNTEIYVKNPAGNEIKVDLSDIDSTDDVIDVDLVRNAADTKDIITVTAAQVGNYIITYKNDERSYSFNVLSYEEKEYSIRVTETKSTFIPSYKAVGSTLTLPKAELVYTNRKGETVAVPNVAVNVVVDGGTLSADKKTVTDLDLGLLIISFEAKLSANTDKIYKKVYNVNVQADYTNETAPVLSVNSFSTTASVNTQVTLPSATARDSYDANPFVEIKVVGPSGPVLGYEVDENGYADKTKPIDQNKDGVINGDDGLVFNNTDRSFYPTEIGKYRVTYVAYNGEGVASSPFSSTIDVKDTLPPVITDLEDTLIPQTWAISTVEKYSEVAGSVALDNTLFRLPFPKVADNLSAENDLTLTVRITNPASITVASWEAKVSEYRKAGGQAVNSSYTKFLDTKYPEGKDSTLYNFTAENMYFSFNYFDFGTSDTDASNDNTTRSILKGDSNRLGDWTITYSLRDEAGYGGSGSARKSYTVNVVNSLTDTDRPVVSADEVDLPKFVLLGGDETSFALPSIGVSDNYSTSRINVNYEISSNSTVTEAEAEDGVTIDGITYEVENRYELPEGMTVGGQSWEYIQNGNDWYMLASEGSREFLIKLGTKISITYAVSDHVGNVARPGTDDMNETDRQNKYSKYYQFSQDSLGNSGYYFWDIDVLRSTMTENLVITSHVLDNPIEYIDNANGDTYNTTPAVLKTKMKLNLGGFVAKGISTDMLEHTGFELSILDADGKSVPATVWSYFSKDPDFTGLHTLTISDIMFTPTAASAYRLNVRFYNISGRSYVYSHDYVVVSSGDGSTSVGGAAATIGSTGKINTNYRLESDYTKSGTTYTNGIIVRKIYGRSFSLIGDNFIAHSPTSYSIKDYVYDLAVIGVKPAFGVGKFYFRLQDEATKMGKVEAVESHEKHYATSFTNTEKPVIEIQGEMPVYAELPKDSVVNPEIYNKDQFITLPVISGYTPYENADITLTVTYDKSNLAKKLYVQDGALVFNSKHTTTKKDNRFSGRYAFTAVDNGDYTVSVTASTSTGSNNQTYTIKVGKRTAPAFTVTDYQTVQTVGNNFTLGLIDLTTEDDDEFSTKITLKDPNNNSVYSETFRQSVVTGSDWYDVYFNNSKITFEKSGNYELIYEVTNKAGLTTTKIYTIAVSAPGTGGGPDLTALTTVLIILGVLLIAGVIVYVVRFKAVKK